MSELCGAIHPYSDRDGITMVLRGYFDESYNPERKAFTVAGWVSDADSWGQFTDEWIKTLREIRGEDAPQPDAPFHMADLQNFQKTFKHWEDKPWATPKRIELLQALFAVVEQRSMIGVSASVIVEDYKRVILPEIRGLPEHRFLEHEYIFCMQQCYEIILEKFKFPKDETIASIFDLNDEMEGKATAYFKKLHNEEPVFAAAFSTITFESKARFIPLQAADPLAYETFKHVDRRFVPGRPENPPRGFLQHIAQSPKIWAAVHNEWTLTQSIRQLKATGKLKVTP